MKRENKALGIANDVAEGIDNGESRKELRKAVAYWANEASEAIQRATMAEFNLDIIRIAVGKFKKSPQNPHSTVDKQ